MANVSKKIIINKKFLLNVKDIMKFPKVIEKFQEVNALEE
jgi:hypothetical protein